MGRPVKRGFVLAVLLVAALVSACGGKSKVAYKELLDADPQVRADAATRLGQAKSKEAVDSLVAILDDSDETVRVSAVLALGSIGDPKAVPALAKLVNDPLSSVRLAVCQALGQIRDPQSLPVFRQLLSDADTTIRVAATRNLCYVPGAESLSMLITISLRDENESMREIVIRAIDARKAREALPQVESALGAESDRVRANAAQVLGRLGDRSSVPALIRALDDPFFKVRSLAAHSLGTLARSDPEVNAALKKRLEVETEPITRIDLAWNLARGGDRSFLGLVRELLVTGDPEDIRAEAAQALGDVGDSSDIPRLEKALNDKRGLVRKDAYKALGKLKKG
jgi:HEAT repeat protein